jgi:2-polyprenyl-3-methyl-5-hydroxy-6-metoxy-1,4-benzoquinol methylase
MNDRAGKDHWNQTWEAQALSRPVNPRAPGARNYLRRSFHDYFQSVLGEGSGRRLLEVGCASSVWLPYFATELHFSVCGLDYSTEGCRKTREVLARSFVDGEVYEADMFSPPKHLKGAFEVVYSAGLLEHFSDTTEAVASLAFFCRPGGTIITLIPNMTGIYGTVQKWLNEKVHRIHTPLGLETLAAAHTAAGLTVIDKRRLLTINFGLLVSKTNEDNSALRFVKLLVHKILLVSTIQVWWLESHGIHIIPPTDSCSPYFAVVARS